MSMFHLLHSWLYLVLLHLPTTLNIFCFLHFVITFVCFTLGFPSHSLFSLSRHILLSVCLALHSIVSGMCLLNCASKFVLVITSNILLLLLFDSLFLLCLCFTLLLCVRHSVIKFFSLCPLCSCMLQSPFCLALLAITCVHEAKHKKSLKHQSQFLHSPVSS
jgi:hypothetical protein